MLQNEPPNIEVIARTITQQTIARVIQLQKDERSRIARNTFRSQVANGTSKLDDFHRKAREYRKTLLPVFLSCMRLKLSQSKIASIFNKEGLKTIQGRSWTDHTVSDLHVALRREYPEAFHEFPLRIKPSKVSYLPPVYIVPDHTPKTLGELNDRLKTFLKGM